MVSLGPEVTAQDGWTPAEPQWQLGRPGTRSLHRTDVLLGETFAGSIVSGRGGPWRRELRPRSHGLLPNVVPERSVPRRGGGQQVLQLPHQLLREATPSHGLGLLPSMGTLFCS